MPASWSACRAASIDLFDKVRTDAWGAFTAPAMIMLVGVMVLVVAFIVYVERCERRIPVQYAKRVVGRKVMGGQSTHLPLRVNSGGVMPVIFASSILTLPQTVGLRLAQQPLFWRPDSCLGWGEPLYTLLYAVGIIFFAYFYVSIVFNPNEVADNMRKYGGFIPGIRPGKRTADHINEILTRITLVGALYLIIISFIPEWMITGIHLNHLYGPIGAFFERLPTWVTNGLGRELLFWRNVVADRGGRGHGHGDPDRSAAGDASLRWLYAAQRTYSRPPDLVVVM